MALLASTWRASVCDWQRIEAWNEYRPLAITATVDISNVALYKPVAG